MSIKTVGLIGATGNLGPAILKALLDADFEVTILSREGSSSTDSLPSHPGQKVVKTNFEDHARLASDLKGLDAIVSNVPTHTILSQKGIIDAAIDAGVKRFIPSEFGSNLAIKVNAELPLMAPKVEIDHYLEKKAKEHPDFSYTIQTNGPFFDWCLKAGLFGNLKTHEMTLYDGGDTKFTTSTLATVGKGVVGIFKNFEATKNKDVKIADTTISQKEIMQIAKEIDGKEWTTKTASTKEILDNALAESKKANPNMMTVVLGQLTPVLFNKDHYPNFSDQLDNKLVGLELMTEQQVKDVIKSCL